MSDSGVSAESDPPFPEDALEVGRVIDAWGVKGWIKVHPFSQDPQALIRSHRWFVRPPDDAGRVRPAGVQPTYPKSLDITQVRQHGDGVIALPRGSADRSAAEALRGARLFVGCSDFPAVDPDEFYWVDLIGLSVVNRDGIVLGTVAGLMDTGPQSVLQVRPEDAGDATAGDTDKLIPFVAAYVDDVNLEQRRITVDWGVDY
ncbi:MAG: ribosome maturation factor RimM [Caldimonas sp.]